MLALYFERKLLNTCLITPFSVGIFWPTLSLGFGVPLAVFVSGDGYNREYAIMQLMHICMFPLMWFGFRTGCGRGYQVNWPRAFTELRVCAAKPILIIGGAALAWRTIQIIIQTIYGVTDYGDKGIMSEGQLFGPWTFFELFGRLNNFSMILVPLLWLYANRGGKVLILSILLIQFALLFASGSRGAVIFPGLFLFAGYYIFAASRRKLDFYIILATVSSIPFLIMMDHFRNSDLFKGTAASDFKGRFNALQGVESRAAEVTAVTEGNANLRLLSAAMVGVSDAVVYERTPGLIPHAGWERIESVLYTWLPSYFYREKQSLHDHNLILRQYLESTRKIR